jgi:hypothetical protein
MKPSAIRIERLLAKVEAKLVPPERKWLQAIIHEGDAEAQEKALAEHVTRHPEDVGRTVEDFKWIMLGSSNGQEKPAIHPWTSAARCRSPALRSNRRRGLSAHHEPLGPWRLHGGC